MQSEVLPLELRQIDLDAGTVRLYKSKNDKGRIVFLTPDLKAQMAAQLERVRTLARPRRVEESDGGRRRHRKTPTRSETHSGEKHGESRHS